MRESDPLERILLRDSAGAFAAHVRETLGNPVTLTQPGPTIDLAAMRWPGHTQ